MPDDFFFFGSPLSRAALEEETGRAVHHLGDEHGGAGAEPAVRLLVVLVVVLVLLVAAVEVAAL